MTDQTERIRAARRGNINHFPERIIYRPHLRHVPYVAENFRFVRGLAVSFAVSALLLWLAACLFGWI